MCAVMDENFLSTQSCNNLCNYLFPTVAHHPLSKPLCRGLLCSSEDLMKLERTYLKKVCENNPSFSGCYLLPLANLSTCVEYCNKGIDWMKSV